jgi:hypothetical protein
MAALCATVLVGFAALAIDVGSWQVARRSMQGAADAAAFSAATAYGNNDGTSYVTQAKGVTAAQGYVDGQKGVTVAVHQPPTSGGYTDNATAIEVIIQQPQPRFFAGLFLASDPTVTAAPSPHYRTRVAFLRSTRPPARQSLSAVLRISTRMDAMSIPIQIPPPRSASTGLQILRRPAPLPRVALRVSVCQEERLWI